MAVGVRSRKVLRLHGAIAHELGAAIVSGRYRPGQILDGEIESSENFKVSRTVYREAVRILAAKGLVESRPRAGTRVSPHSQWHLLDPDVLGWIFRGQPDPWVLRSLFELRTIVEPAAAAFAATRRTQQHLDGMRRGLEGMRQHSLNSKEGLLADLEFHAALLDASDNPFIVSLTNSVTAAVAALNEYKQRKRPLRRDPVPDHQRVYEAIATKDSTAARAAMSDLIQLAITDTHIEKEIPRSKRRAFQTRPE